MPQRTKILARLGSWAALYALLLPVTQAVQNNDASRAAVFPQVTAYNLNKSRLNLPADFAGQLDLLLISFQPEQRAQIETWMPLAQALQHTNFTLRWYRLPISNRENFIFRWWEDSSMRSDESDPETWPWIVPLYVDKNSFRHTLQIPTEHEIAVLLVDKQGRVLWRASGTLTPDKRTALTSTIAATK